MFPTLTYSTLVPAARMPNGVQVGPMVIETDASRFTRFAITYERTIDYLAVLLAMSRQWERAA
jgi:hypothetical protein